MNDYYQSNPSYFSLTSEVRERERETLVEERRLRRSFMYFKDWDSQRAAESEVRRERGKEGKLLGKRRSCLQKTNFGNLKERVTEGLDLERLRFSEWSRTTTATEKETSTGSSSVGFRWPRRSVNDPVAFCVDSCKCGCEVSMSIILKPRSRSTSSLKNTEGMW